MDIIYLQKYELYKKGNSGKRIATFGPPVGLAKSEIEKLEIEMNGGIPFPKAYKELLTLGGSFSGISLLNYTGQQAGKVALKYKQVLQKRGVVIVRPIAVIDTLEGQCGTFIYLDDGDNPEPWIFSIHEDYDSDEGEIIWKSPFATFKEMVDELVRMAENNLQI